MAKGFVCDCCGKPQSGEPEKLTVELDGRRLQLFVRGTSPGGQDWRQRIDLCRNCVERLCFALCPADGRVAIRKDPGDAGPP